ncbi:MAG: hypothetical protein WDN30_00660 [Pararobbsia sp.]
MLSGEVARRYGHDGLPDDTIHIQFKGTAGQSFGAFLARGVTVDLVGDGNDYVGKGLSARRIIIRPTNDFAARPKTTSSAAITVLYGAIEGEAFFRGVAGERFAVRNSGATAVVEGTGDHGCEYMTGGTVVVLGETGRNFAAGMSGGVAYVYDPDGTFGAKCNKAMVALDAVLPTVEQERVLDRALWHGGESDEAQLRDLIEKHFQFTGLDPREIAARELGRGARRFRQGLPVDYKRALGELGSKAGKQALAPERGARYRTREGGGGPRESDSTTTRREARPPDPHQYG